ALDTPAWSATSWIVGFATNTSPVGVNSHRPRTRREWRAIRPVPSGRPPRSSLYSNRFRTAIGSVEGGGGRPTRGPGAGRRPLPRLDVERHVERRVERLQRGRVELDDLAVVGEEPVDLPLHVGGLRVDGRRHRVGAPRLLD